MIPDFTRRYWDGAKIKEARKFLRLYQFQLANSLGCRQQTVSDWELGIHTPSKAYQKLLSTIFTKKYLEMITTETIREERKKRVAKVRKKKETNKIDEHERSNLF